MQLRSLHWAVLALALAGCRQAAEPTFVAGPEVSQLDPPLQKAVAAELAKYCGTPLHPKLIGDDKVSQQELERGAAVFQHRCAGCHGDSGDGNGPAAEYLYPRPRDYRRGIFKFGSTPYGAKPRREDLIHFVRHGARGTSMPEFKFLSDEDLQAVVNYVLVLTHRGELEQMLTSEADEEDEIDPAKTPELIHTIADRWHDAAGKIVYPLTRETPYTPESIERGKQAFLTEQAGCFKCHGPDGRGQPVTNTEGFKDAWNHPTRAADLSAGMFHGGQQPVDIYRRIYAGINGTPMPSFAIQLANQPETYWDLVHYVQYISSARRREVQSAVRHWQPRRLLPKSSEEQPSPGDDKSPAKDESKESETDSADVEAGSPQVASQPQPAAGSAEADTNENGSNDQAPRF